MNSDAERFLRRLTGEEPLKESSNIPRGTRTEASHRMAQRQIAQRRMWGDLKPGQISINQPWPD